MQVWIDTTGWAFPYPLVFWAGAQVACYVHYPTISTDMLTRVRLRKVTYNNAPLVATSLFLSLLKLAYYNVFALVYGAMGLWVHTVMVNSRWTEAHVNALWWRVWRSRVSVVYPPCDTEALQQLPLLRPLKTCFLVSVAQFRPEKNHRRVPRALFLNLLLDV